MYHCGVLLTLILHEHKSFTKQYPAVMSTKAISLDHMFQQSFMKTFCLILTWKSLAAFSRENCHYIRCLPSWGERLEPIARTNGKHTPSWNDNKPLVCGLKVFHQCSFKQLVFAHHQPLGLCSNRQGDHCSSQM